MATNLTYISRFKTLLEAVLTFDHCVCVRMIWALILLETEENVIRKESLELQSNWDPHLFIATTKDRAHCSLHSIPWLKDWTQMNHWKAAKNWIEINSYNLFTYLIQTKTSKRWLQIMLNTYCQEVGHNVAISTQVRR